MRLMIFAIFTVGSAACAQDIVPYPMQKLAVGTLLKYKYEGGDWEVRRVTMNDGKQLKLDFLHSDEFSPVRITATLNSDGQVIELAYPHGISMNFEPHGCLRQIGNCEFKRTNSNGTSYLRKYYSEFKDGVLHAQLMNEYDHVLTSLKLSYNQDGILSRQEDKDEINPENDTIVLNLVEIIYPENSGACKCK